MVQLRSFYITKACWFETLVYMESIQLLQFSQSSLSLLSNHLWDLVIPSTLELTKILKNLFAVSTTGATNPSGSYKELTIDKMPRLVVGFLIF